MKGSVHDSENASALVLNGRPSPLGEVSPVSGTVKLPELAPLKTGAARIALALRHMRAADTELAAANARALVAEWIAGHGRRIDGIARHAREDRWMRRAIHLVVVWDRHVIPVLGIALEQPIDHGHRRSVDRAAKGACGAVLDVPSRSVEGEERREHGAPLEQALLDAGIQRFPAALPVESASL